MHLCILAVLLLVVVQGHVHYGQTFSVKKALTDPSDSVRGYSHSRVSREGNLNQNYESTLETLKSNPEPRRTFPINANSAGYFVESYAEAEWGDDNGDDGSYEDYEEDYGQDYGDGEDYEQLYDDDF